MNLALYVHGERDSRIEWDRFGDSIRSDHALAYDRLALPCLQIRDYALGLGMVALVQELRALTLHSP